MATQTATARRTTTTKAASRASAPTPRRRDLAASRASAPTPRRRDLAATRAALIAAASDVFARKGFAAASLDEIAEMAGFTRGAVHHHFASKEDLFLAVVERHDEQLLAAYSDEVRFPIEPRRNMRRWRAAHADGMRDVALRIELHAHALRNPDIRPRLAAVEARASHATADRLAQRADASGVQWRYPVEHVAEILHVVSRGLLERAVVTGKDGGAVMETFLTMLWDAAVEDRDG